MWNNPITLLGGTYTAFINTYSFVPNGPLSTLSLVGQSPGQSSTWISLHPKNCSLLFSTVELATEPGSITSFIIDSGGLVRQIDQTPSFGNSPPHLAIVNDGKEVIALTYYSSGNVASHILGEDQAYFVSTGNLVTFNGSGPNRARQASSHPHEAVQYGDEVFIPDLGADKVWRLQKDDGKWTVKGFIQQPLGSGPRHIVPLKGKLYTIHEMGNTVTEQVIPPLDDTEPQELLANISTLPPTVPPGSLYNAAELFVSPPSIHYPTPYLYASNRNVSPLPAQTDPLGDTIAIFALKPKLHLVRHVHTGLQQLRGVSLGGEHGQYVAAAGLAGGGIAVFERVDGGTDLKLLARYDGVGSEKVSSFVWT
ncbi:hypothetical protein BS47DRAFT_1292770 [Hydnum rufescens UP504]|uniref:Isomerase YbhE n=1 Tax=Hydnum rufescens UP504 TaxID=1448309 RepID=A0A9P6DWB9_9AGAM|nr:hypothetical protein BS47DRAFT_1292770 [Hydnum rufescens UP504]